MRPGRALDLACGDGRNALWLAQNGWRVTAVDRSSSAIELLRQRTAECGVEIETRVADLEKSEYAIEPGRWDLVVISYYLQRDLFERARRGVVPGGVLLAIVLLGEGRFRAEAARLFRRLGNIARPRGRAGRLITAPRRSGDRSAPAVVAW
jgi:SAM-dependent methyltransferase